MRRGFAGWPGERRTRVFRPAQKCPTYRGDRPAKVERRYAHRCIAARCEGGGSSGSITAPFGVGQIGFVTQATWLF